ncbi:unnamed protein product [Aureobasidium vineae]|uniref:Uncharacterized protein n=1 Tax=Aureobasidium vineae TaxID=2773715 RepID=A0A9N8P6U5_9PEZI|nr:unnamed protein product [Aureobasidium vineae]
MLDQWTAPAAPSPGPLPAVPDEQKTVIPTPTESAGEVSSFLANPTMPTSMPNSTTDDAQQDGTLVSGGDRADPKQETKDEESKSHQELNVGKKEATKTGGQEEKKAEEEYKLPKGLKQPPPEAFKEPDPNSLLDAFGF